MNIFLTSAYPYHRVKNFAVQWLKESQESDPYGKHKIVDNPDVADVILFAEHHPGSDPYFFKVVNHPYVKKYRSKVVLYTDIDKPIAILPTLTPSIEKRYLNKSLCVSAPYIARHCENSSTRYSVMGSERKYLFSFLGASRSHPIRLKILNLSYPNSYLKDTTGKNSWQLTPDERAKFESAYAEISRDSYFILCPRGIGVNTYRLYETMEMGLCPVIISDEWVPFEGPDWDNFSIRIAEKDIDNIPEILLKRLPDAVQMGLEARKNWEQWFSKEVSFHHIVNLSKQLLDAKSNSIIKNRYYSYSQFLRPFHFRNLLRFYKRKFLD